MIEFNCEFSASLDVAVKRLTAKGCKFEVLHETTLGFRARPTRAAKEILNDCGFIEDRTGPNPTTPEQLAALKAMYS